ncbi:MAG: PP2C family protein-serine/threonine phosphatase [Pseudomonadota bacterium]
MTEASIRWACAGRSDRGAKRKINEDSILVRTEAGIWLAADGMGGHEAGDVASRMVAEAVARVRVEGKFSQVVDRVEDALVQVNHDIREHSARAFGGRTMGSTVVSMVACPRLGVCLWAGDSRLYRFRDGGLDQISRDHSEVQELLDRGLLTPEEAAVHPHSNVITRAVGGAPELYLDVMIFDIRAGDIFVLCSDGLYNELNHDEIRQAIAGDVDATADRLLQLALAKGARDNVSLVVVRAEAA